MDEGTGLLSRRDRLGSFFLWDQHDPQGGYLCGIGNKNFALTYVTLCDIIINRCYSSPREGVKRDDEGRIRSTSEECLCLCGGGGGGTDRDRLPLWRRRPRPDHVEDRESHFRCGGGAEGAEASKGFVSKFGRAKSYGEKTIGTPDAGAMSMSYFFQGLAQA